MKVITGLPKPAEKIVIGKKHATLVVKLEDKIPDADYFLSFGAPSADELWWAKYSFLYGKQYAQDTNVGG